MQNVSPRLAAAAASTRQPSDILARRSAGQAAYEQDLTKRPNYHDGSPRPAWRDLSAIAQWSWSRP